ncbi:MAG: cation-translocating P-type ATPase [Pirellulales bacterium]
MSEQLQRDGRPIWHGLSAEEVLRRHHVSASEGLSAEEASRRRVDVGSNTLAEEPPVPAWKRLVAQFQDLVVWILIVAAIISGVLGEWVDTAAILAIVSVNSVIGYVQEARAERALASLQKLSAPLAKVLRGGQLIGVPAAELVPGDVIELEAGDNVPADARLLEAYSLRVEEAALTGESVPTEKDAHALLAETTPLGDRRTMVYSGTVVSAGHATGVIVGTGMQTELGHIAGMLARWHPETTPLQRRLGELGRILIVVCLAIVAVIFSIEAWRGEQNFFELLLLSASLAVAAVPEGLPAVVTLVLAIGLQRMVARNALVRKLPSVETLGSVTVICSDKTGTLTRNEMTVREIETAGGRLHVSGSGYAPHGHFSLGGEDGEVVNVKADADVSHLLRIAAWCNNAKVSPRHDGDAWEVVGDPTEGALISVAMKAGIDPSSRGKIVFEIPFDSERKTMSVVIHGEHGPVMYTKGAPEVLLQKCVAERRDGAVVPLSDQRRAEIRDANARMASHALRVLAFASREHAVGVAGDDAERDLVFVGLVGMIDPPRDEVRMAMATCRTAGIRPVMITGDHPGTAQAIARELQMLDGDQTDAVDTVVTGEALDQLSDDDLADRVDSISVYARVSAEHKLRVVNAWKRRGDVVAMTGDGVNDAPAVKAADIGIAMGITGTDVTKESSDMVLTDDNFASIVSAVEEGRGIYDNIQKFIHYLLSCNAGEVLLMFVAAAAGWPVPLLAIQILWINLVTDGLPALALGMEPAEPDIMHRAPRPPRESVITRERGFLILAHGVLIASVCVAAYWMEYRGDPERTVSARSVTFCVAAFAQLFFAIGCRSDRAIAPARGFFANPTLIVAIVLSASLQVMVSTVPVFRSVFGVADDLTSAWPKILGLALIPVTVIELNKLVRYGFR